MTFVGGLFGQQQTLDVLLLLHMDGTDGSTTFTDSSTYAQSVSRAAGSGTLSTTDPQFGSASFSNPNTGASRLYLEFGTEADDVEEWTIEGWFYRTGDATYFGLAYWVGGNSVFRLGAPANGEGNYEIIWNDGTANRLTSAGPLPPAQWTHVAFTREKPGATAVLRIFIDGVKSAESTGALDSGVALSSGAFEIGRVANAGFSGWYGKIDEYRVSAGCRYTADFTPPTAAYPDP